MSQNYEYFGKYILLEKLATGGMAEVWLARAPGAGGIGKFVAIKKILPQYSDNPEFIQMFRDEAAIAMNLSHSNIVGIYEYGQEKKQFFLVLDYVEGINLRQLLNKLKQNSNQQLQVDQAVYAIKEVAAGLDHAHRSLNSATGKPLNITHRDMSPQNVMISFEGEVKIIDFGIAKAENQIENTKTGTLKGKFGYMSPEQAEGQATDLRTDIFSLGIVLWELLAHERLFIANNEINTLRKIRECQVPSLLKINPSLDPELERITMKALTRDRNLRYQTAAALHRDLNRFLNRTFPDFTPHDFAVYVKTLYADVILETRDRLIEYSKIPFQNQIGKQNNFQEDKTLVTSFPQDTEVGKTRTDSDAQAVKNITQDDVSQILQTSPEALTKTETFGEGSNPDDMPTISESVPPAITASDNKVLDMSALTDNLNSKINVTPETPAYNPDASNTHPIPNHTGGYEMDHKTGNSNVSIPQARERRTGPRRGPAARRPQQKSASGVVSFFVSVMSVIVIGVVAQSFFPKQVKQVTDFFGNVSVVVPDKTTPDTGSNPSVAPDPLPLPPAPNPNPTRGLIVQSNPSGAEIYLNGENTKKLTPARVNIPADRKFEIVLRKPRYVDYEGVGLMSDNIGTSWTATLRKARVAYINIDVRPARNVSIYVDGQKLSETLPITGYAVPANQVVRVKAVNKLTGQKVTESLRLYQDQRKQLILKLPPPREPANKR